MSWCIVRIWPDANYGQGGDKVVDVIGPFHAKETAGGLAERLQAHAHNADVFQVHQLLSPSFESGRA